MTQAGTLFVVATPLGNLGDITLRAVETLRQVDVVAAEDTRRTRQLLHHLDAHPRLISFHAHSPGARGQEILDLLARGQNLALVTDAGTPLVSDPGADLVSLARDAGHPVVPIPGPSAVATALSAAGLPADRYVFAGFPPRRGRERDLMLERVSGETWSIVFFEAPPRLVPLLKDLARVGGEERRAVVARELTKLHEEFRAGTLGQLLAYYTEHPPRGEITLVLAGTPEAGPELPGTDELTTRARALLAEGLSRKETVRRLVEETGVSRNEVYRVVMGA
ncbi:MAG: 16S rRNA (cytidine(1402)-2'-O)-methyltransferase [Gemmatimonadales bacterium]